MFGRDYEQNQSDSCHFMQNSFISLYLISNLFCPLKKVQNLNQFQLKSYLTL